MTIAKRYIWSFVFILMAGIILLLMTTMVNAQSSEFFTNGRLNFSTYKERTASMGVGDIDNDGYLDFYLGTGAPAMTAIVPNKLYRNNCFEI